MTINHEQVAQRLRKLEALLQRAGWNPQTEASETFLERTLDDARLDGAKMEVLCAEFRPQHAEFRPKVIYPCEGPNYQNWLWEVYVPMPVNDRNRDTPYMQPDEAFKAWLTQAAQDRLNAAAETSAPEEAVGRTDTVPLTASTGDVEFYVPRSLTLDFDDRHGDDLVVAILPYGTKAVEEFAFGVMRNVLIFAKDGVHEGQALKNCPENGDHPSVIATRALVARIDEVQRDNADGVTVPNYLLGEVYRRADNELGFRVFSAAYGFRGNQRYFKSEEVNGSLKEYFQLETVEPPANHT